MRLDRWVAVGAVIGLFVAAAVLVVDRGGLLAWTGALLAVLLFGKILARPSSRDATLALAVVGVWALCWFVAWSYVRSTWESGEVVQLEVDGGHAARVWVLDTNEGPVMYYDAPPDVARLLLAGVPLSMTRNGRVSDACADASRVQELPEEQVQALLEQMDEKYAGLDTATVVFYSVLGGRRDRVGLLVALAPCE